MLITLHAVLLIGALLSFVCAAFGVAARVNWIGLGLALWVLAALLTGTAGLVIR